MMMIPDKIVINIPNKFAFKILMVVLMLTFVIALFLHIFGPTTIMSDDKNDDEIHIKEENVTIFESSVVFTWFFIISFIATIFYMIANKMSSEISYKNLDNPIKKFICDIKKQI